MGVLAKKLRSSAIWVVIAAGCLALLLGVPWADRGGSSYPNHSTTASGPAYGSTRGTPAREASAAAGGLLELPPEQPLGINQLGDPSFENGGAGWQLPRCWSVDSTQARTGTHSLRFEGGSVGCASFASFTVSRGKNAARSYVLRGWVKAAAGSNLKVRLTLHDLNDSGFIHASTNYNFTPGPEWQMVEDKEIDLLPFHDGHTLQVRVMVQGGVGTVWLDDVELTEQLPLPLSVFLLYPNYRGYLWSSGPQGIRLKVETAVAEPGKTRIYAVLKNEASSSIVKSVDLPTVVSQEVTFDGSLLPLGSYIAEVELKDGAEKQVASYPAYRIVKIGDDFRNRLVNYIDADNFLVRKGQKRFVWGVYDRISATYRGLSRYLDTEADWERIKGFAGLSTLENYADCLLNAEINIIPFAGLNPSKWDPWLKALDRRGVGHLQIVNNWREDSHNRPFWASSMSDPALWKVAADELRNQAGDLGYYTYDEPHPPMRPTVFDQYRVLRDGNPGGIAYGVLVNERSIFRWRDTSDAIGCDPYPVGMIPNVEDVPFGATQSPPMLRTSVWTRETVRQVYASRPVWMVLQLFRIRGQFPTYAQMKMQAYKAIINGANGIFWWGFVWGVGMEGETYQFYDNQAYPDFRRISHEVMALEPFLSASPKPDLLASVSDSHVETLVKSDGKRIIIFTSNFGESPLRNVTFKLSSVAAVSGPVELYNEGRTVALKAGREFTDSFDPYDVHVYVLNRT